MDTIETMPENTKELHSALPTFFNRVGEVKRAPNAPRFSRKLSTEASVKARQLINVKSITIAHDNIGVQVLPPRLTRLIQESDGAIETLVIQGWKVFDTSTLTPAMIMALVTGE